MVVILMGVAGSGKTSVGRALADATGWRFIDADDYHTPEHVAKMRRGLPLSDADRAPWLETLRGVIARAQDRREPMVLACSALKESYRRTLMQGRRGIRLVHLEAPEAVLRQRLADRPDHFARPNLLESQVATLEPPVDALVLNATQPIDQLVLRIRREFGI